MRVMLVSDTGFQYLAAVIPAMEQLGVQYKNVSTLSFLGKIPSLVPRKMRQFCFSKQSLAAFRAEVDAFQPDIVHVMGVRSALVMTLTALRNNPTIPIVHERISAGGMNPLSPLDPVLFSSKRIDRIIMPSRAMLNNWMGSVRLRRIARPSRNEVLHYAFDLPEPTNAEQKRALREKIGLDPNAIIVGTVCHIRPWKAVEFVAEVVASIKTSLPLCYAVVGGWNPKSDYIETIKAAGGSRLKLLGHIPNAHQLMAAFDIYVTPTLLPGESFGMAFAEAMAHAVPGITMNYGASAEVCDHGLTGFALPESKSVWRRHIEQLINDESLRISMGQAGRKRIAERFSPEVRARDYYRVYDTVIEERRSKVAIAHA